MRYLEYILNKKSYILIVLLCLVFASEVFATNYYIKNGGNDGSAGTSDGTAWATMERVNTKIATYSGGENDTFYFKRGSTWSSDEALGYSGGFIDLPNCTISLDAYDSGAKPIIRTDTQKFVYLADSSAVNINISNFNLHGCKSSYLYPLGIWYTSGNIHITEVDGDGSVNRLSNPQVIIRFDQVTGSVEVDNCDIHDFGDATNPSGDDCNGIDFTSEGTSNHPSWIKIHDNTIYNMQGDPFACSELFFTGSGTSRGDIYDNTFYNGGENSIDIKESSHLYIYRNLLYKNGFGSGGSGSGELITVHTDAPVAIGECHDIHIYENFLDGNWDGTEYLAGISFGTQNGTARIYRNWFKNCAPFIAADYGDITIDNNFFEVDTVLTGAVGSDLSAVKLGSSTDQVIFYQNTVYDPEGQLNYGIYESTDHNLIMKGNIVELSKSGAYPIYTGSISITSTHNDLYNSGGVQRAYVAGVDYDSGDQAAWVSAGHTGSLFTEPPLDSNLALTSPVASTDLGSSYATCPMVATTYGVGGNGVAGDRDVLGWYMGAMGWGFSISNPIPTSLQSCGYAGTMGVTSSENADCKYSVKDSDTCATSYPNLDTAFSNGQGGTIHTTNVTNTCGTTVTYVVKCESDVGSLESNCLEIIVDIAEESGEPPQPAPGTIIGGGNITIVGGGNLLIH